MFQTLNQYLPDYYYFDKCELFRKEIEILGREVCAKGIKNPIMH